MHPLSHAQSSADRLGGTLEDYIDVHEWFDATKAHCAHISHRMLRHHTQGIAMAERLFPAIRCPQGWQPDALIRDIGIQHMEEDTCGGFIPTARHWIEAIRPPAWLRDPRCDVHALARASTRSFGGLVEDWLPLHSWFLETASWAAPGDVRHLAMRHHALGIFDAEVALGRAVRTSHGELVPLRRAAERHVRTVLGRIPAAADWCAALYINQWMMPSAARAAA